MMIIITGAYGRVGSSNPNPQPFCTEITHGGSHRFQRLSNPNNTPPPANLYPGLAVIGADSSRANSDAVSVFTEEFSWKLTLFAPSK